MNKLLAVIVIIYFIDLAGLMMWIHSDQYPEDRFFIGTINAHLIVWTLQATE